MQAAVKYLNLGLSVIPAKIDKRPAIDSWTAYQKSHMSEAEINLVFSKPAVKGIGIVCGKISKQLEVIDVDTKYDLTSTLWKDFYTLIENTFPQIAAKLLIIQTKSGGYHIYYRCDKVQGNKKLARRPASAEELSIDPDDKIRVLIETRGEGGYVIAPPTDGYSIKQGDFSCIPVLTVEQRDTLINIANSFNELKQDEHIQKQPNKKGLSPFDDFNQRGDVIGLLQESGFRIVNQSGARINLKRPGSTDSAYSGNFHTEMRLLRIFSTSTVFDSEKAYNPSQVYAILKCDGDFKKAARLMLSEGYGNYLKKVSGEFWEQSENNKLSITRTRLVNFLSENGFALYAPDEKKQSFIIIKIQDSIIEETGPVQIAQFVSDYIKSLPEEFEGITREKLLETFYRGIDTYSSKVFLSLLPIYKPDFLKDTREFAYFPFVNGVIEVGKKNHCRLVSLNALSKVIWKSQLIDFDISINGDFLVLEGVYSHFLQKISNDSPERFGYVLSVVGYLLHKYKDPARSFAVILAEETENEDEGGGTGKGIFMTAISKIRNVVTIDGKTDKSDKSFRLQRAGPDTDIISIEDCKKNIDFESYYPMITEGITIEKKNKDEIFIPYADSPKIAFTTNFTIPNIGNHAKRRQKVIEFSNFFSPKNTPEDHFKHLLFAEWEPEEWNLFYNLMFWCVGIYLNNGIGEYDNSASIRRKQTKLNFSEEFLDWWDGYSSNGCGNWKLFADMFVDFTSSNDLDRKDYSQKRFKKALEDTSKVFGRKLEKRFNRQHNNKPEYRVVDVVDV